MGIPVKSAALMRGTVGKRVILRGVDEKVWSVKVETDGDGGLSFNKGWPQFYQENSLKPGDMLVFTCSGVKSFDFRVLGHNACDTDTIRRSSTPTQTFNGVEEEEEDDEGDEEEEGPVHICRACGDKTSFIRVKEEEGDEVENVAGKVIKRKIDWDADDIFNSGLAIRPENPYFVSRAREWRKNKLYIPNAVVANFQLDFPAKMVLFDTSGRTWGSTIIRWRDGRLWCTTGWRSLCRANNIGFHDACICEIVERPQHGLCMLVRLLPMADPKN